MTSEASAMRIVILGCAGSGKSTLAKRLGELTGLPVVSLDAIWQPEWNEKNVSEFRQIVQHAHAGENWISEGNFAVATFDIRLPRATQIIWLDRSKFFCLWNAVARVFKRGEPHQIGKLVKVIRFIWNFDRVNRPRIEAERMSHGPHVPVSRFTNRHEVKAFLRAAGAGTKEALPH
jgi:adenylate kinase family enzyme